MSGMMCQISDELDEFTSALRYDRPSKILDLCMAPGGFTASTCEKKIEMLGCVKSVFPFLVAAIR
jgi:hypothetical protein